MEKIYSQADENMLKICKKDCFDADKAWEIICNDLDVVSPVTVCGKNDEKYVSTYLFEAVKENNCDAVEFLLCFGAKIDIESCANPMAELLNAPENPRDNISKLKIARLLLDNGANVNTVINGKTLFETAEFKLYNEAYDPDNCYMTDLLILFLSYGAGKTEKESESATIQKFSKIPLNRRGEVLLNTECENVDSNSFESADRKLVANL